VVFSPVCTGDLPAKSSRPAAGGRRWSGRRARRQGGGPDWRLKRGEGSPEQGVPRRCKPSGGERRCWSKLAAEGAGKGVEGAPGVGAVLGVVSGGSEGDRDGGSRWLNDGSMTV
jgi:hypothetical protein